MLTLPKQFDENEWFIITVVLLSSVLFKLPKRLPTVITILILFLSMAIPKIIDHSIAAAWPYNLYDLTDSRKFELFDVILDGVYCPFGYLCIYFYDKFHPKGFKIVLYILSWTVFAVFFEYIAVKLHVFNYRGWKLIYSFPTYMVVISLFLLFYKFVTYYYKRTLEV
ncbi:hypothetical protein [Priestia aryabhattai]|uniref:Transmembrane protein n=1 Tax=Priestia aryabhattai TaxID=412384 RepID=A0ABD7X469_PRIAR|nr:hypothetical protein [Priestia aryabhattai]WEA47116.1 hypothetical protein PWO00_27830 [Priestia aryabhattai]